jgi:hypothetical protein
MIWWVDSQHASGFVRIWAESLALGVSLIVRESLEITENGVNVTMPGEHPAVDQPAAMNR